MSNNPTIQQSIYPFIRFGKGGGLLAQAARNQTQGVEERYAKGTTHSSRGKVGPFASALMAKTVGRQETWLEVFIVVRMAFFKQAIYQCGTHFVTLPLVAAGFGKSAVRTSAGAGSNGTKHQSFVPFLEFLSQNRPNAESRL